MLVWCFLPGEDAQLSLWFVPSRAEKLGANRVHLHLTSASLADQQHTVTTALGSVPATSMSGSDPRRAASSWPTLRNEFCVIEPGNAFLAGVRLPGGLAWFLERGAGLAAGVGPGSGDRDPVTARRYKGRVGDPPMAPRVGRDRQRFDLAPADGDQQAEVDRLVLLGATRLEVGEDGAVVLVGPGGNEFCVRADCKIRRRLGRGRRPTRGSPRPV
jgi:hypothetical protein